MFNCKSGMLDLIQFILPNFARFISKIREKFNLNQHEQKWLQSFEECELVLYRRYVDDIVCLFSSEFDADKFFIFLNQRHPKIKFTIEKQTEN